MNCTLFVQDASGGARVQILQDVPSTQIGDSVDAIGFPETDTPVPALIQSLLRPRGAGQPVSPQKLDVNEVVAGAHGGVLVRIKSNLLSQKTSGIYQVLGLQEGQRVFEALLATNLGAVPFIAPGSRLEIADQLDGSLRRIGAAVDEVTHAGRLAVFNVKGPVPLLDEALLTEGI